LPSSYKRSGKEEELFETRIHAEEEERGLPYAAPAIDESVSTVCYSSRYCVFAASSKLVVYHAI
jgi:hypothetical protein